MSEKDDQLTVCTKANARTDEAGAGRDRLGDGESEVALRLKDSGKSCNALLLKKGPQIEVAGSREIGAEVKFFDAREEPLEKLFWTAAGKRAVAASAKRCVRPVLRKDADRMRSDWSCTPTRKRPVTPVCKRRMAPMLQQDADRVRSDLSSAAFTCKRTKTPSR
jgi:hypothetical protein